MHVFKDIVTIQGHHAVGVFQIGGTAFVFGDNGEKENTGPNWEFVLFRPYSKKWLHINIRRGMVRRILEKIKLV